LPRKKKTSKLEIVHLPVVCLYCSSRIKGATRKELEHVLPEAIGCDVRKVPVCGSCNNRFSVLDTELVSRTPMALIARHLYNAAVDGFLDVGPNNQAIESYPTEDWSGFYYYPQFVLGDDGPEVYLDQNVLKNNARLVLKKFSTAVTRMRDNSFKETFYSQVDPRNIRNLTYSPRVFFRTKSLDFESHTPVIKYVQNKDRDRLKDFIKKWDGTFSSDRFQRSRGSHTPIAYNEFDALVVYRALIKSCLNILSTPEIGILTEATKQHFSVAIDIVTGKAKWRPSESLFRSICVVPDSIENLHAEDRSHRVLLRFADGLWIALFSFFGGECCFTCAFKSTLPINAYKVFVEIPLRTPRERCRFEVSKLWTPLSFQCSIDHNLLYPTLKLLNPKTELEISLKQVKRG
jgi:hypothetical protein